MSLNMRGLNQLLDRLAPTLDAAIDASADAGVELVRDEVPVRSGDLQGTTRKQAGDGPQSRRVVSGSAAVSYGPFVNFGTPRQSANPYMDRAAERLKPRMVQVVLDHLRELIRSAAQ